MFHTSKQRCDRRWVTQKWFSYSGVWNGHTWLLWFAITQLRCRRKLITVLQKFCTFKERARTSKWQIGSRYGGKERNSCPKDQSMVVQHVASQFTNFPSQLTDSVFTTDNTASLRKHKRLHCNNNHKSTAYTFFELKIIFLKRQKKYIEKFSD